MIPIYRPKNYLPHFLSILKNYNKSIAELENNFAKAFDYKNFYSFTKGRYAIYNVLKELESGNVIIPAGICPSVAVAVEKANHKIQYLDYENSYSFTYSINEILTKVNSETQAIIIDLPFGYPTNIDEIVNKVKIIHPHLLIIEDCAVGLGAKINNKYVGNFGDIAIFSFGFPGKEINAIEGGGLVINNDEFNISIPNRISKMPLKNIFIYIVSLIITNPLIYRFFQKATGFFINSNQVRFSSAKADFKMNKLSLCILNYCIKEYEYDLLKRKNNSIVLENLFKKNDEFKVIEYNKNKKPSFSRFVILSEKEIEETNINRIFKKKIEIKMYSNTISDSFSRNPDFKNVAKIKSKLFAIPNYIAITRNINN